MVIQTKEQFIDYLLYQSGYPINVIEVDRDTQISNIVDDTIQWFQRYNNSEGSYLTYAIFNTSAGVSEYSLSGYEGVFDIGLSLGVEGINTLFSPANSLLYSDFIRKGSIMGTDSPDYAPGLTLTSWDSAMNYLKEIRNKFGKMYTVRYNSNRNTLVINPTPMENSIGVIYAYKREDAINLYNHPLVKKLALGKLWYLWGINLTGKYSGGIQLPDGLNLNGDGLKEEGKRLQAEAEMDIKAESEPIDFFMA